MKIQCPNCKAIIAISSDQKKTYAGQKVKIACNGCEKHLNVPIPSMPTTKESAMILGDIAADQKVYIYTKPSSLTSFQRFDLTIGTNQLGRSSANSKHNNIIKIETQDSFMSQNHCVIERIIRKDGRQNFIVSDQSSTNGTFINDDTKRLHKSDEIYLELGDRLTLGSTEIVIDAE